MAYEQTTAEHIALMPSAAPEDEPVTNAAEPQDEGEPTPDEQPHVAAARAPTTRTTVAIRPPLPPPPEPETPEATAERRRRNREILGIEEPQPRRRWRR